MCDHPQWVPVKPSGPVWENDTVMYEGDMPVGKYFPPGTPRRITVRLDPANLHLNIKQGDH